MDTTEKVSVACQTDPNLIDKLIDNHVRKQLDDIDLYQEYVRSAQCAQFWPLDKNPIRSLVPTMLKVDLPEQHLKNESLMFDLVQAITNNSKLVNLLAKYIHHIVPNVIISKRIDLIPLITCTIRVCRDANEQERLMSLLFNLIKRPNEEQRRMILSGIIVVLQVSPNQSSALLLPNLWDHVNDKFPERRILLAESCATLAHYVRPVLRTNLILSILIQLLKDKNVAVRSAACNSFACLLSLIMDRNDEVFDACLSATEDIIQDVLLQTPVNFCEHRYELEQMRFCALETVYPLLCMWAVKLNRFKHELAEFYLAKAERYFNNLLNASQSAPSFAGSGSSQSDTSMSSVSSPSSLSKVAAAAAVAKRRSVFFESRSSSVTSSTGSSVSSPSTSSIFGRRRQSAFVASSASSMKPIAADPADKGAQLTSQRAISAYLKMINYLVPFIFSDAVNSCAWLTKSKLHLPVIEESPDSGSDAPQAVAKEEAEKTIDKLETDQNSASNSNETTLDTNNNLPPADLKVRQNGFIAQSSSVNSKPTYEDRAGGERFIQLFDRPVKFANKLLDPTLIIDETAIVAFHDQLEQEHMIESLDWLLSSLLPKFSSIISHFSHKKFYSSTGGTSDVIQEFLSTSISSIRQLCLLFGRHLTRNKIRPLIKQYITNSASSSSLFTIYIASLTSFEPIEQHEFEEIVLTIRQNLNICELSRNDVEILAISIKILSTNSDEIQSPSTRQKFLTYILDALVNYSNQIIRPASQPNGTASHSAKCSSSNDIAQQQTQTKEFMLIIFRHILNCLIDQSVRPSDWAHILVTKFLPLIISLANDSADVYVCTYARLMCAQLVETFDTYLNSPKLTKQTADAMLPALASLRNLTEQIKASNLKRQIDCLAQDLNEKFFKEDTSCNNNLNTPGTGNVASAPGTVANDN